MRYFLWLSCLLVSFHALAQRPILEQYVGWKGKDGLGFRDRNEIELQTILDKDSTVICSFLISDDSVRVYLLDAYGRSGRLFKAAKDKMESYAGAFIKGDKVHLYLYQAAQKEMHSRVFDIHNGLVSESAFPFHFNTEKIIDRISYGDHFLYLTVNPHTSTFYVRSITDSVQEVLMSHQFKGNIWRALSSHSIERRALNVRLMEEVGEPSPVMTAYSNKLYLRQDTLLLVMNNKRSLTTVYRFNLRDKTVDDWQIRHSTEKEGYWQSTGGQYNSNSYLLGNRLYYVQATADSLLLQVVDFYRGTVLKAFSAGREGEIDFKNTPFLMEGKAYRTDEGDTKTLLRDMVKEFPVIGAMQSGNGTVQLYIGALINEKNYLNGAPIYGPGGTVAMPGVVYGEIWRQTIRFKVLLDAETGDLLTGSLKKPINERIEFYMGNRSVQTPSQGRTLMKVRDAYYLAYYNMKNFTLHMLFF